MIKQKRGIGTLTLIIIVLIILAVCGVVAWFLLSGDGSAVIGSGNSIPQPPALPT